MIGDDIAKRYATVLFNLDTSQEMIEKIVEEFKSFLAILKDHPLLLEFYSAPQISKEEKKKITETIFKDKLQRPFLLFISYMIEQERVKDFPSIFHSYNKIVNDHLGIWEAKIITAIPLEQDVEDKLRQKLEKQYHKKIKINTALDPHILGGAILLVENEMIDWSLANRLKKIKDHLLTMDV